MTDTFIKDLSVVEFGDRLSTGLCGALLQRLGADVVVIEPDPLDLSQESKWHYREILAAGKQSMAIDFNCEKDIDRLVNVLEHSDVALISSDWAVNFTEKLDAVLDKMPILCDLTAFGSSGPMAGQRYTDSMLQAFSGLMDITGSIEDPPTPTKVPVTECCAAVFAAAGILSALRSRKRLAVQKAEISLFDTAVSMLSTFLPNYFVGERPTRIGNRHASMSPWNAYRAIDGWVLLCAASNDMWGRVCSVINRRDIKSDPRFAAMSGRVMQAAEVDAAILPWINARTVGECVQRFSAAGVACGPVYEVKRLFSDPNLVSRKAFSQVKDPRSGAEFLVPAAIIRGSCASGRSPQSIPSKNQHGQKSTGRPTRQRPGPAATGGGTAHGVLSDMRVLEMGSYTTSPLAARNLGALGAYVVKAEPQPGELSRASPPHAAGQSYFCTLSNSDKRSVVIDLRTDRGNALFRELLAKSDVFVENMKPGVLSRHGFGPDEIERINPKLVYCSVSGFGAGSPLADRPAMDTTIQGMAGIMDLTRQGGVPHKMGISIADIVGGQFALVAILAGLEYRERTGKGQYIELSMQEVSAWLTQFFWNGDGSGPAGGSVTKCVDGYVYATGGEIRQIVAQCPRAPMNSPGNPYAGSRKVDVLEELTSQGVRCVPVQTVSEVASHPQTVARELIVRGRSMNGKTWPLLASPIRLFPSPVVVRRAIGAVGADLDEVLRDWGIRTEHSPADK